MCAFVALNLFLIGYHFAHRSSIGIVVSSGDNSIHHALRFEREQVNMQLLQQCQEMIQTHTHMQQQQLKLQTLITTTTTKDTPTPINTIVVTPQLQMTQVENKIAIPPTLNLPSSPELLSSHPAIVSSPSVPLGVGLLCVILSATRPGGVDHVTPLSHLLHGVVDKIAIFDADVVSTRTFPWADEVVRGPQDHINAMVQKAMREAPNDKHHDPVSRIQWRAKNALDYAFALEYAWSQREEYPFVLVLEDDVWFTADFRDRLKEILSWDEKTRGAWFAWTLFHCKSFDKRPSYAHGDPFEFQACTQALLYHTEQLKSFVSFTKANYAEDPFDFLTRNYQYDTHLRMNVAIPSMVQHVGGGGSTLADKLKEATTTTSGCHAFDFDTPATQPTHNRSNNKLIRVIQMKTDGIKPDDNPRPRWK